LHEAITGGPVPLAPPPGKAMAPAQWKEEAVFSSNPPAVETGAREPSPDLRVSASASRLAREPHAGRGNARPDAAPASIGLSPAKQAAESGLPEKSRTIAEPAPATPSATGGAAAVFSPAQQIISHLIAEYPAAGRARDVAARGPDADVISFEKTPLRVFRVTLQPETLGEVEVVLRRTASDVKIRISVDSEMTAQILQRDTTILHDRLRAILSDGALANLEITVRDQPAPVQTQLTPSGNPDGGSASPSGYEPGSNRKPSSESNDAAITSRKGEGDEDVAPAYRSGSGLVV
jgi:flagellar hook-length control protein FliK